MHLAKCSQILDLWMIHHKCCKTQLLKPLHTLQSFEFSGDAGVERFCTQGLDFAPFHSCGDAAGLRCQGLRQCLNSLDKSGARGGPRRSRTERELVLQSELGHLLGLFPQSSNGLDWRLVLHALPKTMPVRSIVECCPPLKVVSLYLSLTDQLAVL